MRRVLAPVLALLAALTVLPAAASAAPWVEHVVGGSPAGSSADAPWQALVLPGNHLCGGSILDATHVVTAAHCVYDEDAGTITAASDVTVHAGIVDAYQSGQAPTVIAVTINPAYNPYSATNDSAILTLQPPGFTLNATTVKAIGLTDVGFRPASSDSLLLSGWGSTAQRAPNDSAIGSASRYLQYATGLHTSPLCGSVYSDYDDSLLLCAGQANLDACQGDSGGPLALQVGGAWQLAGIVTGGAGCAWPGYPGFYARVSAQPIHDFLAQRGVGYAVADPVNVRAPVLSGGAAPYGRLSCSLGSWSNALAYDVTFRANGVTVGTGSTSLTIPPALAGQSVTCEVTAYGLTTSATATSAPVTIAGLTAAPTTPAVTVPAPAPTPGAPTPDSTAPTTKVTKSRCSRTLCQLDVMVSDPAPSAGVKGVEGTVTTSYKATCRVKGKKRPCTKSVVQKLKSSMIGPGVFRVTTPKLRRGKHVFALVGVDLNGNRQVKATALTKTTR